MKHSISKSGVYICFIALILWCIVTALGKIFTFNENQIIDPSIVSLYVFLTTSAIFLFLNGKKTRSLPQKCRGNFKDIFWLNITTLGAWGTIIYALRYLEPSLTDTIALCVGPAVTIAMTLLTKKTIKLYKMDYLVAGGLCIVMLYVALLCLTGKTSVIKTVSTTNDIISTVLCLIAGASVSGTIIFTKNLYNKSFTPYEVIIVRFIVLIIFSVGVAAISGKMLTITSNEIAQLFLLSLILLVIPRDIANSNAYVTTQPNHRYGTANSHTTLYQYSL